MADEIQPSAALTNDDIETTTNEPPIEIENTESNRLLSTDTHETFVTAVTSTGSGEEGGERTESFVTARGQTPVVLEEEADNNNDTNNDNNNLNETMNGAAAILELANELDNNDNIEESGNNNIENSTNPIEEGEETLTTAAAVNILPTVRTPPKTNSTTKNNNQSIISNNNNKHKQRQKELKRLDKLQRRIPPTLDLD